MRTLVRLAMFAIAGAAVAAAFLHAPVARADADTYVASLTRQGFGIYDPRMIVATGHQICHLLETRSEDAVATMVVKGTRGTDDYSDYAAQILVTTAETELCPDVKEPVTVAGPGTGRAPVGGKIGVGVGR